MNQERLDLDEWVDGNKERIVELICELIEIRSENKPPHGNELSMQIKLDELVRQYGFTSEMYALGSVEGLIAHPHYWPGRNYENRPNVFAEKKGLGNGRSLLFSVHADVVPGVAGQFQPFHPEVRNNRIYGRGSNDMKGGIAAILTAFRYLQEQDIELKGDVSFESVVDEEMGGANGTLAGRVRQDNADAVIIPEPTNLRVCPSHLGGVTWRITVKGKGGMGFGGEEVLNPIYGMGHIVREIEQYHTDMQQQKKIASSNGEILRPNVVLSIIRGSEFEPGMADGIPETCLIEVWVECLPGEELKDVEKEFKERIEWFCSTHPSVQKFQVEWEQIIRFLPGSVAESELIPILSQLVHQESGVDEAQYVAPFACDAFMFNLHSPSPAIVLGPKGENAHSYDEFVDIDSVLSLTKIYIKAMLEWCNQEQ